MAQPTPYTREFNFANQQAATPSTPIPAPHLDAEFNRVKLTTDQILANLALIQADDGTINGAGVSAGTIGYDQLDPEIVGDLIAAGATEGAFDAALTSNLSGKDKVLAGALNYLIGLAGGVIKKLPVYLVTPFMFTATGDGHESGDYTTAMNAMFAHLRSEVTAYASIRYVADCTGLEADITGNGVNMTGFQAWNLELRGGTFTGKTTGKAVFDPTGSRGYLVNGTRVIGDATYMPTVPFLIARATATYGFCDNCGWFKVSTEGYFSVAAFYAYAQESTTHFKCQYWNYNHTAHVAIFEGYDSHPQTSQFKTIVTGGQSFINNKYINCDFRYLPVGKVATITGVSKASSAVISCASHPFVDGDTVIVAHITNGMVEISGLSGTVASATPTSFAISGINSTGFTTWTAGGLVVKKATQPAIYMDRMKQHSFDNCYVVAYGDDAIQLGFPDGVEYEQCLFDFLIEGACGRSGYRFLSGTGTEIAISCTFKGYATHIRGAFFSTSTSGTGSMSFYGGEISVSSHANNATLPLVTAGSEAEFAFYSGIEIEYPNRAGVLPASYAGFRAVLKCQDGDATVWGHKSANVLDGAFDPTVTASSGSITTVGALDCQAKYEDDWVQLNLSITITTNGTGATQLRATLPFTPAEDAVLIGCNFTSGTSVIGRVNAGVARVDIVTYANAYPVTSGDKVVLTGRVKR